MKRALLFVAGLAAGLATSAAGAQTSTAKPGRVGPGVATRSCIGTAATPVCAAETLLACMARAEAELCRRVGVADPRTAVGQPPSLLEYVIDRSSIIKREDIPDDLRDTDWYKPGYALIEIERRSCAAT